MKRKTEENQGGSSGKEYSFYRIWSHKEIHRGPGLGERACCKFNIFLQSDYFELYIVTKLLVLIGFTSSYLFIYSFFL